METTGATPADSGKAVVERIDELSSQLRQGLQDHAWQTMEAVNGELRAYLEGLSPLQLEEPGVQQGLDRLQALFSELTTACIGHRAESLQRLQGSHQRERAVRSYYLTGGMQEK